MTQYPKQHSRRIVVSFMEHRRQLVVWSLVVMIVVLIMFGCYWFGRHYRITAYLVGLGAAVAAFLGPIPGLVTPETRGKWLITILIAAIIGFGVWYSSDDLQKDRDSLEKRLDTLTVSFKVAVRDLPKASQDKIFENTALYLRGLYTDKKQQSVLDLSGVLLTIDSDNGYALYFAGLGSRGLGDRSSMRTYFRHYQAAGDEHSEAQTGTICYSDHSNPSGFCRERTDWINHLMANDFFQEAENLRPETQGNTLAQALKYERYLLAHRIMLCGFEPEGSAISSYDLLRKVADRARSGPVAVEVESLIDQYRMQCGLKKIQASPVNPMVAVGGKMQLKIIGTYEPGSPGAPTGDLTKFAVFRSSDVKVADVSPTGEVLAHKVGAAEIRIEVQFRDPGVQILTDSTILKVTAK